MDMSIIHGGPVDHYDHEVRQKFLQKFKASYAKTLNPMSEDDAGLMNWHVSDLVWAADSFADVFGKEQLQDVLQHLMRDESYFSE